MKKTIFFAAALLLAVGCQKSELIEKIASQNPNLTAKEVEKIVNVVFEKIKARGNAIKVETITTLIPK